MAKKTETPLKASERLKDFNPHDFPDNTRVAFKHDGLWQVDQLTAEPEVAGKEIRIQTAGNEFRLNIPPRKVEIADGEQFRISNKDYAVTSVNLGPDGELWYNLENTTDNADVLRGVAQEFLLNLRQVSTAEARRSNDAGRLVTEIKNIKGVKREELTRKLHDLGKKTAEMRKTLGSLREWSQQDEEAIKTTTAKIQALQLEFDEALRQLDADIRATQQAEGAKTKDTGKQALGEGVMLRYERELASRDAAAKSSYDAALRGHKELLETEALLAKLKQQASPAHSAGGTGGRGGGGGGGGGAVAPATSTPASTALLQEITDTENRLSGFRADSAGHPRSEPKLEEPSKKQPEQESALCRLYGEYEAVAAGPAGDEQIRAKQLKDEVDKRRKEQAVKEGQPGGDYVPNTSAFEKVTAQKLREVMNEWKELKKEAPKLDFDEEKRILENRAVAVAEKMKHLNRPDLKTKLQDLREGSAPTAVCIRNLDKSDLGAADKIIDLMHQLNDLDLEIDAVKLEAAPASAEEAEEAGLVDLPKDIVRDLLLANQQQVQVIMQEAFAVLIGEGKQTAGLETSLKEFINGTNPDEALRAQLAQFGIRDWEAFRDRFSQRIAPQMARVLLEMADSEMRMWLAQAPSDIAGRRVGVTESWQFSALAQMKGTVALRMVVNMAVLGGVGVGTALATKSMIGTPGVVRAGIVGGAVGLAKAGLQRVLGRDQSYFQNKAAEAKKAAEDKKRRFISAQLMQRMFNPSHRLYVGKDNELAHLFSIALRCATAEETDKALVVEDEESGETIRLTGEAVLIYHEALKRAAEDEGVDEEQKAKFAFAKAIHALHNNEAPDIQDTPPLLARGLQWLTDAYSGRNVLKSGEQPAEILERDQPEEVKTKESKVNFAQQAAITSALGASIAMAAVSESDAVRIGIGAAFGAAHGERVQHEKNRARADRESQTRLDTVLAQLEDSMAVARNNPTDLASADCITDYRNLLSALLAGTAVKAPLDHLDKKIVEYFRDHARDAGSFLQRNLKYRTLFTNAQREIARSGFLERAGFTHALQAAQVAGEKMKDEAKNSLGVRAGRYAKGKARAVVYGAIGAGISYAVGQGIDAAKHALGFGVQPAGGGVEHQPPARAGEAVAGVTGTRVGVGGAAAEPVAGEGPRGAEPGVASTRAGVEVEHTASAPQEQHLGFATIDKGQGILHAANQLQREHADLFANWTQQQIHEWRVQELQAMGFQFRGSEWGYPVTVHQGAQVELIQGTDGKPHLHLIEDPNVTKHEHLKWMEADSHDHRTGTEEAEGHAEQPAEAGNGRVIGMLDRRPSLVQVDGKSYNMVAFEQILPNGKAGIIPYIYDETGHLVGFFGDDNIPHPHPLHGGWPENLPTQIEVAGVAETVVGAKGAGQASGDTVTGAVGSGRSVGGGGARVVETEAPREPLVYGHAKSAYDTYAAWTGSDPSVQAVRPDGITTQQFNQYVQDFAQGNPKIKIEDMSTNVDLQNRFRSGLALQISEAPAVRSLEANEPSTIIAVGRVDGGATAPVRSGVAESLSAGRGSSGAAPAIEATQPVVEGPTATNPLVIGIAKDGVVPISFMDARGGVHSLSLDESINPRAVVTGDAGDVKLKLEIDGEKIDRTGHFEMRQVGAEIKPVFVAPRVTGSEESYQLGKDGRLEHIPNAPPS